MKVPGSQGFSYSVFEVGDAVDSETSNLPWGSIFSSFVYSLGYKKTAS